LHLHAGLRHLEDGIGAENVVVRLVDLEQNLRPCGGGIPVLRGGAEAGASKIRGAAEVGDQLADAYAHCGAAGKTGSLERAGGNRRVRVGADGGEVARKQGAYAARTCCTAAARLAFEAAAPIRGWLRRAAARPAPR
jgi:hypothetical protein